MCAQSDTTYHLHTDPHSVGNKRRASVHALALLQDEGTARALRLAEYVNVPLYVVHVMSADAADEVARAKRAGQRVVGEAVASGFAAEERMVWHPDFKARALCRHAPTYF